MKNTLPSYVQLRFIVLQPFLFLVIAVITFSCQKNALQPEDAGHGLVMDTTVFQDNITAAAYPLVQSLPSGYVKNGTVDYTKYIQAAINKYDNIIFPPFPIMVNDAGLQLRSNTRVSFETGSKLILKASDKANYDVISIRSRTNVNVYYANIRGDRKIHRGSGGEWGNGIGIYSSQKVKIISSVITDCWGDGIYVGAADGGNSSADIVIDKLNIQNSRRSAISVTSGKGITISNSYLAKSNGTIPEDGICIEPNNSRDEISGIKLINNQTNHNKGYGVEFSLSKMYGGSDKKVDAVVTKHIDKGSKSAAYISCDNKKSRNGEKISGTITFNNPQWMNFGEYVWRPYGLVEPNLVLTVINPKLYNQNNVLLSESATVSLLKEEIHPKSKVNIIIND